MADPLVDNGTLTDYAFWGKQLSGTNTPAVQAVELATATEGGLKVDLAKAEDSAHASGDFGLQLLAVRTDTAAARAGTDGDYIPLIVDNSGRLHVNIGAAISAAGTSDGVAATLAVDKLMNGLALVTPTFAVIDHAATDNTIVAAAGSGNIILVHSVFLVAAAAVNVRFESGTGGTALTGQMNIAANSGFVLPFSPVGWFKTAANTLLNLELSAAVSVDGNIGYTVVT